MSNCINQNNISSDWLQLGYFPIVYKKLSKFAFEKIHIIYIIAFEKDIKRLNNAFELY